MANQERFSHAATIFHVSDIEQSMVYYVKKLGFKVTFTWDEPISYAVLKRGEVSLHLAAHEQLNNTQKPGPGLYVFVHDVDQVYQEFKDKGVIFHLDIADRDYHMRDFDIKDPDGNIIAFGMGI